MDYKVNLRVQKCLHLNIYLSTTWFLVTSFFLYQKIGVLDHRNKYLSITVFVMLVLVEPTRLYFGHIGNLTNNVQELASFLMLTALMQLPLVSFFTFNMYLLNTPTEVTLHVLVFCLSVLEIGLGYSSLQKALNLAKHIYLSQVNRY